MAKKTTEKAIKDIIIDAALDLASARAWSELSFKEILDHADISLADAHEYFDDKTDILVAYGRRIDRHMLENCVFVENEEGSPSMSCREKIFDLIMERFDYVNENRAAVMSILSSFKTDPKQAVISMPHLGRSMERILETAGIKNDGICGAINVTGLSGIYLHTLRIWKKDESSDLSKTMAALDKTLDKAEMLYNDVENRDLFSTLSGIKKSIFSRMNKDA